MTAQTSDRDSAADGKKLQLPFPDVLWAVAVLGAIFGLTPIIVFYLLTINWPSHSSGVDPFMSD